MDDIRRQVYTPGQPVQKFTIDKIAKAVMPSLNAMLAMNRVPYFAS